MKLPKKQIKNEKKNKQNILRILYSLPEHILLLKNALNLCIQIPFTKTIIQYIL